MTRRSVRLRERAAQDVDEAVEWYAANGGPAAAADFVDAFERALRHVAVHPLSGSSRYADTLLIPELRTWPIPRFPYLVFYVVGPTHVDVWRVLHAERQLADWMRAH